MQRGNVFLQKKELHHKLLQVGWFKEEMDRKPMFSYHPDTSKTKSTYHVIHTVLLSGFA